MNAKMAIEAVSMSREWTPEEMQASLAREIAAMSKESRDRYIAASIRVNGKERTDQIIAMAKVEWEKLRGAK